MSETKGETKYGEFRIRRDGDGFYFVELDDDEAVIRQGESLPRMAAAIKDAEDHGCTFADGPLPYESNGDPLRQSSGEALEPPQR